MNASFAPFLPLNGKASLISQSGALLIAIDAATYVRKVGFNKLISIGNMADVDFADLIGWLNEDEDTTCISLYIEGLKDGRSFMDVSRKATKPIIAINGVFRPMVQQRLLLTPVLWPGLPRSTMPLSNRLASFRPLTWITCSTAPWPSPCSPQ